MTHVFYPQNTRHIRNNIAYRMLSKIIVPSLNQLFNIQCIRINYRNIGIKYILKISLILVEPKTYASFHLFKIKSKVIYIIDCRRKHPKYQIFP